MVCVKVSVMYCLLNGTISSLLWTFVLPSIHRTTSSNTLRCCMERVLFTTVLGRVYIVGEYGGVCVSGWGHLCYQNGVLETVYKFHVCLGEKEKYECEVGQQAVQFPAQSQTPSPPTSQTPRQGHHNDMAVCACVRSFVRSYASAYESSSFKLENEMCF